MRVTSFRDLLSRMIFFTEEPSFCLLSSCSQDIQLSLIQENSIQVFLCHASATVCKSQIKPHEEKTFLLHWTILRHQFKLLLSNTEGYKDDQRQVSITSLSLIQVGVFKNQIEQIKIQRPNQTKHKKRKKNGQTDTKETKNFL